jgi:hypothetical protein
MIDRSGVQELEAKAHTPFFNDPRAFSEILPRRSDAFKFISVNIFVDILNYAAVQESNQK